MKEIGDCVFLWCSGLESISVASGNSYYDSRNECNAIIEKSTDKLIVGCKNTVIPQNVKAIGKNAFRTSHYGLLSIIIPDNVEEIGEYAFQEQYDLESITFGQNVQKIGSGVVDRGQLKYIRMQSSAPCEITSSTFNTKVCEEVTLYVPQGSLASYMIADNWSKFKNIKEGEPPVLVTELKLDDTELTLHVGDSHQLVATIVPDNATDKTVAWSSDDASVATVSSSGLVTAVARGVATIACKANDEGGVAAVCKITVINLPPTAIALANTATVAVGSSITLIPEFTPANAMAELAWSTDDESIAVVSSGGVVTGKKKGQTFVNVETDNGKAAYCKLTVTAPKPTSIELPKNATVNVGDTLTLTPTIMPEGAETTLTWNSDDVTVVQVSETGTLTGTAEGLAIVTVSTSNGLTSNVCKVTVQASSGISTVAMDGKAGVPVYSTSGQRLIAPRKGINIIDGKKVVVK